MGECNEEPREVRKYLSTRMSATPSQSSSAAKVTNAPSKKKAAPTNKFKMSYAAMIIEAIQELKQKKGSSRQAIMKHIAGKETIVPNALMITKTLKKLIEEGRIVPGAQAGHSGAGSYKLSPQEKSSIGKAEKAAAKKVVKKTTSTKKVVKKSTGGKKSVKKVAKKSTKSSSKKSGGSALYLRTIIINSSNSRESYEEVKKSVVKAKKPVAGPKKPRK